MLYLLLFLVGFLTDVSQCCEIGYYSSNVECQKCPNNCSSCRSASSCTLCHTGFWGETCSESCHVYCHNKECNQISGQCLSCKEGYFNDNNNNSCSKCPENCATCSSKQFCFNCKSGYKDEYCQNICSSCKPGTSCDKFTGYCHVDCVDGFSGELCDKPCDSKCKSCNRYKRHECLSCAPDRHGPSCNEQRCTESCDLNRCDPINGSCTFGCMDGYWGEKCEHICSRQCNNQVCYQRNGECKDGCLEEFSGMNCSTRKSSVTVSLSLIGGISGCAVFIFGVFVLSVLFIRKRRIKRYDSSLADKTTKEPEEEPLNTLNEPLVDECDDLEKKSAQTREKENVNNDIFLQISINPEKANKSRASDISISIEGCFQDGIDVHAIKNTPPIQLKASSEKEETLPPIHVTAKSKGISNKIANEENVDMKRPLQLATHSIAKESTTKAEHKLLPDTSKTIGIEGAYMEKPLDQQLKETNIVKSNKENKNATLKHERVLETPRHGKVSTISKIPTLSSLKKDANYETNTFQDDLNNNNSRVETSDDKKEHLSLHVTKSENMKTTIPVTRLTQYVANKDKSAYINEYKELSEVKNPTIDSMTLKQSHLTSVQTRGSPVILEDEESSYINAYFIDAGSYRRKAYISYIGKPYALSSCKKAFWKTVLQERCAKIVMLTTASLPEEKCTCISSVSCSEMYGDIKVLCKGEENMGGFKIRKYTIMKQMVEREVQRLLFTKWPSYGLPDDAQSFVDFVKYANEIKNNLDGPVLVYCSSGKERTGTFIALDILTNQGVDKGYVDIFGCVRQLQEQRLDMICDWEQYQFLHETLALSLTNTSKS